MKKYLAKTGRLLVTILKYLALAILALVILTVIFLGSAYRDLKNAATDGLNGKAQLNAAVLAAKIQDWPAVLVAADNAHQEFSQALQALDNTKTNLAVKNLGIIRTQIDDLEYLLSTGKILAGTLEQITPLVQKLDNIRSGAASHNFVDLPAADKIAFLQQIYESEPEITGLKADLELADLNLGRIHKIGILWPIYSQISNIKQELDQATALLTKFSPALKLLPALAGFPSPSHFLLVLQNNDELRPSGGFIGTYGLLNIQNGAIISLSTDDSYHLDLPAYLSSAWNMTPPLELTKYLKVNKWYLRDANWSPDWPSAAKKITEIYNGENALIKQPTTMFTGVIAITPDLVSDLIKLVGPITVNGTTYNAADFQSLLQYNVEVAYKQQSISAWNRKDVINDLIAQLKTRLFNLPSNNWNQLAAILDNNLSVRNIQMYFFNPDWEALAQSLGADGAIARTDSDFMMVVDANLAAYKSDAVIKKDLSYSLSEDQNGLVATVQLDYQHQGKFDWRTTRYRSYTRIYAPLGSQLISLNGTDSATQDLSTSNDATLDKTVFGFFFTIEPGNSRTITLKYRLPSRLEQQLKDGSYQLLVQKQAGQRINSLKLSFQPLAGRLQTLSASLKTDQYWTPISAGK